MSTQQVLEELRGAEAVELDSSEDTRSSDDVSVDVGPTQPPTSNPTESLGTRRQLTTRRRRKGTSAAQAASQPSTAENPSSSSSVTHVSATAEEASVVAASAVDSNVAAPRQDHQEPAAAEAPLHADAPPQAPPAPQPQPTRIPSDTGVAEVGAIPAHVLPQYIRLAEAGVDAAIRPFAAVVTFHAVSLMDELCHQYTVSTR